MVEMTTLALVVGAVLFVFFSPQITDMINGLKQNGRIQKSSVNANNNVRITNSINNVVYKPVSVLPNNDNELVLEVETVAAPHILESFTILTSQLKHDAMKTLVDGVIHYRLIERELLNSNFGINSDTTLENLSKHTENIDSKYTKKELALIASVDINERTIMEGEIMNLKASRVSEVNNIIENTARLSSSRYGGG